MTEELKYKKKRKKSHNILTNKYVTKIIKINRSFIIKRRPKIAKRRKENIIQRKRHKNIYIPKQNKTIIKRKRDETNELNGRIEED